MSLLLTVSAVVVAAALGMLLGGAGGNRAHRRRLSELESDLLSINERLTREQKKRAGVALQDGRRDHMAEAAVIAAQAQAQKPTQTRMAGRANGVTVVE